MKTDELRGRIAKLESLAGKGACPYCRLYRRHTWLDTSKHRPKLQDPSLIVTTECEACGAPSSYDLSGYAEDVREG